MTGRVRILSPAKINLHLDVYPKREDGFHPILSLFQLVAWFDEIELSSLKRMDVCEIEGDFDFSVERNIIFKSLNHFRKVTSLRNGVRFKVLKRLPQGAGLGGGSSNAAAALRGLNLLFGTGLTDEELADIGAEAGSDVPFFCRAAAAIVEGRGDVLTPLDAARIFPVVIVVPVVRVNTKEAYGWIDEDAFFPEKKPDGGKSIAESYFRESPEEWGFDNSFRTALEKRYSVFGQIREDLYEAGARYANVSGSGSAVYGIFSDREAALSAGRRMAEFHPIVEVTNSLDRITDAVLQ